MLLELAEDIVLTTVKDADNHLKGFTPSATTKEIGRQVCVCDMYHCISV